MSAYSPAPHFINNISPKNPHIGTIASLLRFNDGPGSTAFTDAASITWTASGPVTESATHILSYTSAGDYSGAGAFNIATLTTPNTGNLLGFEVNPWCIECFAYVVTGTNQTLCAKWPAAGTQGQFQIIFNYAAGVPISLISFTQWVNGNSTGQVSFTSLNPSLFPNSWAHYAITYDGTGYRIFVNGTNVTTSSTTGTAPVVDKFIPATFPTVPVSTSFPMYIGSIDPAINSGNPGGSKPFLSFIQDFKVTVGAARYTHNFTPPTPPLSNF